MSAWADAVVEVLALDGFFSHPTTQPLKGETNRMNTEVIPAPSTAAVTTSEAAAALGVTKTAIALYLGGRPETLGPAKRRRIVVKTLPAKDRAVTRVSRIDTDC